MKAPMTALKAGLDEHLRGTEIASVQLPSHMGKVFHPHKVLAAVHRHGGQSTVDAEKKWASVGREATGLKLGQHNSGLSVTCRKIFESHCLAYSKTAGAKALLRGLAVEPAPPKAAKPPRKRKLARADSEADTDVDTDNGDGGGEVPAEGVGKPQRWMSLNGDAGGALPKPTPVPARGNGARASTAVGAAASSDDEYGGGFGNLQGGGIVLVREPPWAAAAYAANAAEAGNGHGSNGGYAGSNGNGNGGASQPRKRAKTDAPAIGWADSARASHGASQGNAGVRCSTRPLSYADIGVSPPLGSRDTDTAGWSGCLVVPGFAATDISVVADETAGTVEVTGTPGDGLVYAAASVAAVHDPTADSAFDAGKEAANRIAEAVEQARQQPWRHPGDFAGGPGGQAATPASTPAPVAPQGQAARAQAVAKADAVRDWADEWRVEPFAKTFRTGQPINVEGVCAKVLSSGLFYLWVPNA